MYIGIWMTAYKIESETKDKEVAVRVKPVIFLKHKVQFHLKVYLLEE